MYASPSRHSLRAEARGDEERELITYPTMCFSVDAFEDVFASACTVRDSEVLCIELCAEERDCLARRGSSSGAPSQPYTAVLFLGSIRYEALKHAFDAKACYSYMPIPPSPYPLLRPLSPFPPPRPALLFLSSSSCPPVPPNPSHSALLYSVESLCFASGSCLPFLCSARPTSFLTPKRSAQMVKIMFMNWTLFCSVRFAAALLQQFNLIVPFRFSTF